MIVEITTYSAAEGISHDTLMKASKAFDANYCSRCKGLIRRQVLKTESGYMDIFHWESKADVEHVQATFMEDADALTFGKLLDTSSFTMQNLELLDSYKPT